MKCSLSICLVCLSFIVSAQIFAPSTTIAVSTNPANGFVGIGTGSPQAKLEVAGGGNFIGGRLYQTADLANDNIASFVNTAASGYGL